MTVTQDSNAGERDESPDKMPEKTEAEVTRELTPQEIAKAREAQEIADGHRYQTEEFRTAREAGKPVSDRKKARDDAKAGGSQKDGLKKDGLKKDGARKDMPPAKTERIAKVLARAGLASRREVERLIGLGKIAVNGRILETPAVLVAASDVITVDGQVMGKAEATRLWRYHKPVGLITTHSDPQGRPTLFEQLPRDLPRVISVGRLDLNSEGLLLLTNDGELARALEKPSSGWVRQYRVRALGHTTQARLDHLKNGTTVDGVIYGPMEATLDKVAEKADGRANVWLTVSITEGKNREVRKVLESIGLKVNRLIRLAYGPFLLGNLDTGEVEEVGPRVIRELLADVVPLKNLPPEGASQTQSAPRARPARDDGQAGRRGGGDRFRERPGGEQGGDKPAYAKRPKPAFTEKREYKERDFDERPRFEGDGTARDRRPDREEGFRPRFDSDRPRRDFGDKKPYAKKPYGDRPAGDRDDPRRAYTPRPDRGAGNDRKAFRTADDIPAGEAGAYERAKREFGGQSRPARSDGDRPAFKKPYPPRDGEPRKTYDRKPRFDRAAGEGASGDARKSYAPRPDREGRDFGDRKPAYGKKPYAARPDREGGDGGERRSFDKKPYSRPRPAGEGDDARRSYTPRPDREGQSNGKPYDKKPYARKSYDKPYASRDGGDGERKPFRSDRPAGERPGGGKPFGGRPGGDKPRGDFSRGPRPDGPRSGPRPGGPRPGPRPGGKPGGRPFGDRKPRSDS